MKINNLVHISNILSEENKAWVLYKKPQSDTVCLMSQHDDELHHFDPQSRENGFILAPFLREEKTILLKNEQFFHFEHINLSPPEFSDFSIGESVEDKNNHLQLINKALDNIDKGIFSKVVLSRKIAVKRPLHEPLSSLFLRMIQHYPDAFCYVLSHPKLGCWAAATPETLVRISGRKFKTMALAATQNFSNFIHWSKKEIREQHIVTEYIIQKIKNLSNQLHILDTQTVKAGHLAHLCTPIHGTLSQTATAFQLIDALHPTPAVCGFPTSKARTFILEHETYPRKYYTGYCGAIFFENTDLEMDLFVNLRCMELLEKEIYIYVGGGIVSDSSPIKEWNETQSKARVMLNLLNTVI